MIKLNSQRSYWKNYFVYILIANRIMRCRNISIYEIIWVWKVLQKNVYNLIVEVHLEYNKLYNSAVQWTSHAFIKDLRYFWWLYMTIYRVWKQGWDCIRLFMRLLWVLNSYKYKFWSKSYYIYLELTCNHNWPRLGGPHDRISSWVDVVDGGP